jgi:hypothetical protein
VNGRAELLNELCYLTAAVALPPLLLRTVMLCGLTGHVNSARNRSSDSRVARRIRDYGVRLPFYEAEKKEAG